MDSFRWDYWNVEHIAEHGVTPHEAQEIVRCAQPPFPREVGGGKHAVWGQTATGTYLQVVFIYDPPGVVFVIHARPLSEHEKRLYRRRRK